MDDYDMGPQTRYRDYPASVASSHTQTNATSSAVPGRSPLSRDFHDTSPVMSIVGPPMDPHREGTPSSLPPGAAAPHLLGMRAETGSIFREAVWPPPGQPSAVDLSRIVDDVMGPTAGGRAPPTSFRGDAGADSRASLIGDDPFASMTTLPGPITPAHSQYGSTAHSRETSDAPLLRFKIPSESSHASQSTPGFFESQPRREAPEPPGSPMPAGKIGPLFVTNMDPLSPTSTISHASDSPPPTASAPRNWLERSPKKPMRPSLDESGVDLTDVTSDGHGVGRAV
ncbi:hypothetical protein K466DRAFT_505837 [Polyporus arcularius HHB13444]|uniref:Uncharacterized protein n=1 Tax=Polyporus arcularius HHB13444 TaxID=1314778 RepID=A0A5C3NPN1_9APHY|nr:hypothetical protein K466DRAFT_505837 [Polyporus arcularius HHB13444]